MTKILLTGQPGCGKTTIIKRAIAKLNRPYCGFCTSEIRDSGERLGFAIDTLSEPRRSGILAHVDMKAAQRVGKYGVNIEEFERLAVPELIEGLSKGILLVIDEIGKMELFSTTFRQLAEKALSGDSDVLASIMLGPHPFCDRLKKLPGIRLKRIDRGNREAVLDEVLELLSQHDS